MKQRNSLKVVTKQKIDTSLFPLKPYDFQLEGIEFMQSRKRVLNRDKPGLGKGGTNNTKILTPYGWITFADVKVGHPIIGQDGNTYAVTGVFHRGKLPTYRVTFSDKSSVLCDDDHLWEVNTHHIRSNGLPNKVISTREIRKHIKDSSGRRFYQIPMVEPINFVEFQSLEIHPYLLGVLLGDGSITHSVGFSTADEEISDSVKELVPVGVNVNKNAGDNYDWYISTSPAYAPNPVLNSLRYLGLQGKKSEGKFIPEKYKFACIAARILILQGLLDTDGHVRPDNNIEYCTVSKELAEDVQFIVQSLGGTAPIRTKKTTGQLAYRMSIALPVGVPPFKLSRKANAYHDRVKYPPTRSMESIEYVGEEEITCISVDAPDCLYVTDDCIVTHNTLSASYASVGKTLISAPNYLTEHWYEWLGGVKKGANKHKPYAPTDRQNIVWARGDWHHRMDAVESDADFTIVNQEMFQSHGPELVVLAQQGTWDTLILDESQHYRNREAERSKNALEAARCIEYVYELSATPIYREVDDLYMQLRILQPDIFTSYFNFVDKFCIADSSRYGTKVMGVRKSQIPELDAILQLMSIGRDYKTAGRELPQVITEYITVQFPKPLMTAYNQMIDEYRLELGGEDIRFEHFSQIMRAMRLFTAFPGKLEAAQSIIEDNHRKDKVIVFTWYRDTCQAAARLLGGVAIDGSITSVSERRRLALSSKIVVATIESLSEGIDLSDARAVIYLEENYTPGSMEQSMARVVRERKVGQNTDPVLLYYVHVQDTIDIVIHNTHARRNGTAREVLREALHLV